MVPGGLEGLERATYQTIWHSMVGDAGPVTVGFLTEVLVAMGLHVYLKFGLTLQILVT